jgi:hypothetical protein
LRSWGLAAALALAAMASGCRSPAERAAQAIVEKNAKARGGLDAWRKVQALSLAGNLEAGVPRDPLKQAQATLRSRAENKAEARRAQLHPAEEGPRQVQLPFVMELKRPRATRMEIVFQGKTAVQVYDGTSGWKVRPFLGRSDVEPFTDEELKLAAQQAELDGPLIDYAAKGNKVELVGSEQFEGREAFKLKVTTAAGTERTVLVDAESSLEVRVDGTRRLDGKEHRVWTTLRDYKPVDGLLIPHTLETTVEGVAGSEKILVEKISVNPEVADARFSKPQ